MLRGTFAIVDGRAIAENVRRIRSRLRAGVELLVAVKADGYGHGANYAARVALGAGASMLGVASVEEGIRLREADISAPILVLGAVSPVAAREAAKHQLAVTVTDDWSADAPAPFDPPLTIHLKFDSGMSRLGFRHTDDVVRMARWLTSRPDIHFEGLYTHLACADSLDKTHSEGQISRFRPVVDALEKAGLRPGFVHAANSAGTLSSQDWQFDMVRSGISTYGYLPSPDFLGGVDLVPALHLYTFVTRVETIDDGETVGYGATFTARRQTRVATLPVGYADGYPRYLSNRADVWVRGVRAPVIGNICMDQTMIDVTDIEGVAAGDCVTLYGRSAPAEWHWPTIEPLPESRQIQWLTETFCTAKPNVDGILLDELAAHGHTISYEIMCALASRVPRLYIEPF